MSTLRAVLVLLVLTIVTLISIPTQQILLRLGGEGARTFPLRWHRFVARLIGFRIRIHGAPSDQRPLLVVSNHSSWIDIVVLSTLMPLSFISKSEIAGWPVFGTLARLQRTVFVRRNKRAETGKVANEIARRLGDGDILVLFAEGTSSTGNQILPFKTALFGAVAMAIEQGCGSGSDTHAVIQPLTVAYTRLAGLPTGRQFRPMVCWYGNMTLAPHLWTVLKEGAIDVECAWGEPIVYDKTADRKKVARLAEDHIRTNMSALITGRPGELQLGDTSSAAEPERRRQAS